MSLTYLPRSAWAARPSLGPVHLNAAGVLGIALHYPGMGTRHLFKQEDVAHALSAWQNYHMDDRKWSDIAYQAAIDQAGRKWNLRGLTTRSAANGDEEVNLEYGAILLVVGDDEVPTGALINSTREVVTDFRRLYPKATAIKPHSAVRPEPTSCPGNQVRALIAAGRFEPANTTPTPEETDEMTAEQFAALMKVQGEILTELRGINARVGYVANDGMKDLDAVRDKVAGTD